jgi:hypothetical protein
MDWGAIISAASTVAAQTAAARAQANANKAVLNQANDRTAQSGYQTDKSLDLQALNSAYQAALSRGSGVLSEQAAHLAAPGKRAANSVRGDVLANVQDAVPTGVPKGVNVIGFSGGLRPSMFSGNTRALGQQMSRQALLDQMAPEATPFSSLSPLDTSSITRRTAPGPTPLPQGNTLDAILANIGMYGSMASAVAPALQQQPPPYQEMRGETVTPSAVR